MTLLEYFGNYRGVKEQAQMKKTKHMQVRMSQRGIKQELVRLVLSFGEYCQDGKVILGKKTLKVLLDELKILQRIARQAHERGGYVVAAEGDKLITTYRLDSYNKTAARYANGKGSVDE